MFLGESVEIGLARTWRFALKAMAKVLLATQAEYWNQTAPTTQAGELLFL
jgi:hypothetical protein